MSSARTTDSLYLVVVALMAFCLPLAQAEEDATPRGASSLEGFADEVVRAVDSGEVAAVEGVAKRLPGDPWLLIEELRLRGDTLAAASLARALPADQGGPLLAYLAAVKGVAPHPADYASWQRLMAAELGGGANLAPPGADGTPLRTNTVLGVVRMHGRGTRLAKAGRRVEALSAIMDAASAAAKFGWIDRALHLYGQVGYLGYHWAAWDQARDAYERIVAASLDRKDTRRAAWAMHNLGNVHAGMGRSARALELYERALPLQKRLGDLGGVASCLIDMGHIHLRRGRHWRAGRCYREGLEAARKAGQDAFAANALDGLGHVEMDRVRLAESLAFYRMAFTLRNRLDSPYLLAASLHNLGNLQRLLGSYDRAVNRLEGALKLRRGLGHLPHVYETLNVLADAYERRGDYTQALQSRNEAYDACVAQGNPLGEVTQLMHRGNLMRRLGQTEDGLAELERAVTRAKRLKAGVVLPLCLAGIAAALLEEGETERALELCVDAFESLYEDLGGLSWVQGRIGELPFESPVDVGLEAAAELGQAETAFRFGEYPRLFRSRARMEEREQAGAAHIHPSLHEAVDEARARFVAARAIENADEQTQGEAREDLRLAIDAVSGAEWPKELEHDLVRPLDLTTIQGWLGTGRALVLYDLPRDVGVATVVTKDVARVVRLAGVEQIRAATDLLRTPTASSALASALARARTLLVEPLRLGAGIETVILSPGASFQDLPLGALFAMPTVLTPSATELVRIDSDAAAGGRGRLAVGSPAVSSLAGMREAFAARPRLATLEVGLPIAFDGEVPSFSAFVLPAEAGGDRFWMASDVLREDVPADLVVLTAPGAATNPRDDGDVGPVLVLPFLAAGARQVLGSLWDHDEQATAVLLEAFRARWRTGDEEPIDAAQALYEAQQVVSTHPDHPAWAHPYHWAGWTLWGLPD